MAPILGQSLVSFSQEYLFLFLVSLALIFFLKAIKRSFSSHSFPPSPPKLPLIGNLHQLSPLLHQSLHSLSSTYGPLMYVHFGQVPTLIVSSADMAAEVYKARDAVFSSRSSSKAIEILTYNHTDLVFAPYGKYWRYVRRICTKNLLSNSRDESYYPLRAEEVGFMAEKIREASLQSGPVNLSDVFFGYSNDVICRVVSGKFSREEGRNGLFRVLLEENNALLSGFHAGNFFPKLGWLDGVFGLVKRVERNFKGWDDVLSKVIKEHREGIKDDGVEDFTDVLLSQQEDPDLEFELKDDHVKSLLADMFAAGTDTSAITLEWAMSELVRHSEEMKKLLDEVRGIVGQNPKVTVEDLNKMSYLKAVVKETLRLHPPAPLLIPKATIEECHISGYYIPKGTRVFINGWSIGRDPKYWESPNDFIPERFIKNKVDFRGNDFQFIPFGAGRRICAGMQFGLSTVELGLATLVHQFDWELPHGMTTEELDMEEAPGITTFRKNKLKLIAKPRDLSN